MPMGLPSRPRPALPALLAALLAAFGCGREVEATEEPPEAWAQVPWELDPPVALGEASAWELAAARPLDEARPADWSDLHHVFHLSENIVSGGEPLDEAAFQRLADMGIRTILSVDGKPPQAAAAARYGLRYVHVPIRYSGFTRDELLQIAKTFRELPGPFYVHCFHGKHRGPAAAAIGRVVLDGVEREQAIAEMRQWCGTSRRYEGLYRAIATEPMPTPEETAAYAWDFPSRAPLAGVRAAMVRATRIQDFLEERGEAGWAPDPAHPDLDAARSAAELAVLFEDTLELEEAQAKPEAWREGMLRSIRFAREIEALARRGAVTSLEENRAALDALEQSCVDCHAAFRNDGSSRAF